MALDKERLYKLEIETFAVIEEAFREIPATLSMSVVSQFINGFYLLRRLPEELMKTNVKDKQTKQEDKGEL